MKSNSFAVECSGIHSMLLAVSSRHNQSYAGSSEKLTGRYSNILFLYSCDRWLWRY